jgi:Concanavalin A-like lectin/glucanases superfamily/Calcineurin-like phosphoesterase
VSSLVNLGSKHRPPAVSVRDPPHEITFVFATHAQNVAVMKSHSLFSFFFLLAVAVAAHGDPADHIQTNRSSPQVLPLPKADDLFHFIIFGDRTGGPPEGIQVLAQAVRDTNLLDPDLVMTVGDLIQGYNAPDLWNKQMTEYRETMKPLRMPWFPVAGNHDIYWRGDGRPPTEHEANYEKHFGPLWYWFEHKKCGFLVLFSDEGDPTRLDVVRSFDDPVQQKFSPAQLGWLRSALEQMKSLKHLFVFMHHPRWAPDLYPGTNWPEVHRLLVANGNVRACFAGHIHRLRYDGVKDGVEYFALATTGGGIPGIYPRAGYLHHFNIVTVRPEGIKVSVVPVGSVVDPRLFEPERGKDMDLVRRMNPEPSAPMSIDKGGLGAGIYDLKLNNPTKRPVEFTVRAEPGDGWIVTPDHQHALVEPGVAQSFAFTYVRVKSGLVASVPPPVFVLETDYLEEGARTTLPPRRFPAQVALPPLPPELLAPASPPAALHVLKEASGVRIDSNTFELPDGPFTLEGWVRPEKKQASTGLIAKTQSSDYGLLAENGVPAFLAYVNDRYAAAKAKDPLPLNEWTHLAGVFDGQSVALFVNGRLVERSPGAGFRQRNDLPLYIGADPGKEGVPTRPLAGWVDEVRLSRTARYAADFTPAKRFEPDDQTVLLHHLDRTVADLFPDHAASHAHGRAVGTVQIQPAP